eukprot:gene19953-26661_t
MYLLVSSANFAGKDYYDVLGVQRGASDQEIKKSYYQLAKKYHPDTNMGNTSAAETFQEIQKAYETLRDPEKRNIYNQVGREGMDRMESGGFSEAGPGAGFGGFQGFGGFAGGGGGGAAGFGPDIFERMMNENPMFAQMFGGMSMQPLRITFMEAIKGTRKRVVLPGQRGREGGQQLDVDIPPGVDDGDQIEVQVAMEGRRHHIRIAIPVNVEEHPIFTREGLDILMSQALPLVQAMLGTTISVPTIDGKAELKVPAGTQNGDRLRLRAKGILDPRQGRKGDQLVKIVLQVPKALSLRQIELLKEFEEEEKKKGGDSKPSGGSQTNATSEEGA